VAQVSALMPESDNSGDYALAEASRDCPLTPGAALEKLFIENADRGANPANDELVAALRQRARAIQALADRRC
jgi:hypothetical protein